MAISTTIPPNWKLPLFWGVVDGSQAGNLTESQPALLVGQMGVGTAVVGTPVAVGSVAIAGQLFGVGSMLERMFARFFAGNTTQTIYCLPVADPAAGIAATGKITFTAGAMTGGVLNIYIAGQKIAVTVYSTDTATTVAANVAAAINALPTMPLSATSALGVVTLTCDWKGLTGNDIDLRVNYLGLYGGETTPGGLTVAFTPMANGAGTPNFTTPIANIQALQFYHVAMPYNDTASLAVWDAEYGFAPGGRWAYTRQQYGWIYNALRFDYADAITWGLAHNSSVITTMVIEPLFPSPIWEVTAAYCAQGAAALLDDPARPLQTLVLAGLLPPAIADRFNQPEQNSLTNSGLAVQGVNPAGNVMILREALQYQFNAYGQADTAFALLTVLSNLAELMSRMKAAITTKYPRHKLAPDGTRFGAGQAVVTPAILKAELIAEARKAEYDGLMSNVAAFKANLLVEIDDNNPNRVNVLYPPQLMGQLRDFDVLAQFRLAYSDLTV